MIRPTNGLDQLTICTRMCRGACCRYITVPIPTPRGHDDWDQLRWWLAHEGVTASKDEDGWSLVVETRCKNLRQDNTCAIYANRMETCAEYEAETCEYTGPIDQEFELRSEADLGSYLARKRLKRGRRVLAAIRAGGLLQVKLLDRRKASSGTRRPAERP